MRLFANPQVRHAAHITVRGPYPDYQDPRAWSAAVKGQNIHVAGVGTFFEGTQNIVHLCVDSPAVRAVWDKTDYANQYNPHLTIYAGDSRRFAESLRDVLTRENPQFTFAAAGIEPIVLGNGPRPLIAWYDPAEMKGFMSEPPVLDDLLAADENSRLAWIGDLAASLARPNDRDTVRVPAAQGSGQE
jgi:hypothetical protein